MWITGRIESKPILELLSDGLHDSLQDLQLSIRSANIFSIPTDPLLIPSFPTIVILLILTIRQAQNINKLPNNATICYLTETNKHNLWSLSNDMKIYQTPNPYKI